MAGLVGTSLLGVVPAVCLAQETRGSEFTDVDEPVGMLDYLRVRLTMADRYVAGSDFGAVSASTHQAEGRLRVSFPVARNAAVRFLGGGRARLYDFDGSADLFGLGLGAGAPFGDLYTWDVRMQGAYLFDEDMTLFFDAERWALLLQGGVRSNWEAGSGMSGGLRAGGTIALGYSLTERLEVALGISLGSRLLEGGVGVSPLIDLDWRINPDWRIRSYGVGLQIERALGPSLVLFTRARLESRTYRLGPRPGIGKGSLRVREVPVGLGLEWGPWRWLRFRVIGGAVVHSQLRLKDQASNTLSSVTSDAAGYFTLRIDVRN
jgi:hypothetical protein